MGARHRRLPAAAALLLLAAFAALALADAAGSRQLAAASATAGSGAKCSASPVVTSNKALPSSSSDTGFSAVDAAAGRPGSSAPASHSSSVPATSHLGECNKSARGLPRTVPVERPPPPRLLRPGSPRCALRLNPTPRNRPAFPDASEGTTSCQPALGARLPRRLRTVPAPPTALPCSDRAPAAPQSAAMCSRRPVKLAQGTFQVAFSPSNCPDSPPPLPAAAPVLFPISGVSAASPPPLTPGPSPVFPPGRPTILQRADCCEGRRQAHRAVDAHLRPLHPRSRALRLAPHLASPLLRSFSSSRETSSTGSVSGSCFCGPVAFP